MNMKIVPNMLALLSLAAILPVSATTVFYDFNDPNQLGWNGITSDSDTATWSSSGGIDNTGRILSGGTGDRTRMITTETSFNGSLGELSIGLYFNADPNDTDGQTDDRASHIGFKDNALAGQTRNASPGIRFDEADHAVSVRLASLDDNGLKVLDLYTGGSSHGTTDPIPLNGGNWYYWSATFTPTGDGIWDLSSSINSVNQDTFEVGGLVNNAFISATGVSGPSFDDFTEVWGGVALAPAPRTDRGTLNAIDDVTITAIPEPGTLMLVGIAIGSLLCFRRRG